MENTQTTSQTPNTTTSTNTTFIDQAPLNVEFAQQAPILPQKTQVIPDEEWYAAQQLAKPIVLQTLAWNGTDGSFQNLVSFNIPDVIASLDTLQSRTLRMYAFYRANWVLRFQLNGTKFHQGQLIAAIIPFNQRDPISATATGGYVTPTLTGFPSVQISASATAPVELKIPFIHMYDYFMSNAQNNLPLAKVQVAVLNQLQFSTGASPALNLTISLYAEQPEVHVPIYDHDTVFEGEAFGLFSNVAASLGHAATGNFKGFFQKGSEAQKDMSNLFDKPSYVVTSPKTITPVSAMAHGKGTETTIRLGLDPSAQSLQPSEVFGNVEAEMTYEHATQTPMLVKLIQWSTTQASGQRLQYFPVSPLVSYPVPTASTVQVWSPTHLAWVSSLYTFWQGSIKIRIDAICTSFHTGRLLIAFIPNGFTSPSPTLTQALSCPNVIMDIQSSTQVEFIVPFLSNTPYKQVDSTLDESSVTGYVYVYVLNELVRPDNVVGTIDLNIYYSAGEDMKFFVPKDVSMSLGPFVTEGEAYSDFKPIQTTKTEDKGSLVSLSFGKSITNRVNRFGEDFPLADLIKRFAVISHTEVGLTSNVVVRPTNVSTNLTLNPLGAISLIYACWYGSLRYKYIFPASRTDADIVSISYSPNGGGVQLGSPIYLTNLAQDSGIEVEVPCYTRYNTMITTPVDAIMADGKSFSLGDLTRTHTATTPTIPQLFNAAGDDLRFYYLIAPPTCFGLFVSSTT
jgi:hypothetical protein